MAEATATACCPYCGDELPNPRRVQCGKAECRRQAHNARCREHQRKRRAAGLDANRKRTVYTRTCCVCGEEFTTRRKGGRYCGNGPGCNRLPKAPVICGPSCRVADRPERRTFIAGYCPECGTGVVRITHLNAAGFCSRKCRRREMRRRRRAAVAGPGRKTLGFRSVAERDRWVCQLCGEPVSQDETVPHPLAPTMDHVVPLARGGAHEMGNVQLAHFICNSVKGDGDDLRRSRPLLS